MTHAQETRRKLRTLVVDDEPLARTNLLVLLRRHPEVEIVGECESGTGALAEIRNAKPDLVFLDVQMPECDGFDVLEMLGGQVSCAIIFVTAYDTYALRAFEVGALDYLLKPFDDARFERMLERAKNRIGLNARTPQPATVLAVKGTGHISFVRVSEIDWIEAADYYASLHVGHRTHLLRRSMAELEQELDPTVFCRIHRSAIVKLDRVRSLELNENGEYDVLLSDGNPPPTPRFNMPCELGLTITWEKLNPSRHTWFVFESRRRRLQKSLSDLDGTDPNIHGATVEGIMRELCNAFVRRRGAVPSVPDMMKTYRRVVRQLDDVLVNAGANSLFEARVSLRFVKWTILSSRSR